MNETITKMQKRLKKHLDRERYEHTLGVMYTAGALAMRYECDLEQALTAGLLHDCAKCIPGEKKIRMCDKYHLHVSEVELANPSLLHARLGAFLAAKRYHVDDKTVINAIACHTTGRPEMTLLDKIIYIADYIEPARNKAPRLAEIRKIAFENLDLCMYEILHDTLEYLDDDPQDIDQATIQAYNYYSDLINTK